MTALIPYYAYRLGTKVRFEIHLCMLKSCQVSKYFITSHKIRFAPKLLRANIILKSTNYIRKLY